MFMKKKNNLLAVLVGLVFIGLISACANSPKENSNNDFNESSNWRPIQLDSTVKPLDAELSVFNYPRPVEFFEFASQKQNLRMAYVLVKPAKPNGQTVILMHGKNFSAAYWESTISFLVESGFQVLAPDQIGFGKSSKPAAYQFSLQALSENTKMLMEFLKIDRVSVVGHSMGGMLATRFSLLYPNTVEKLILVNPIGLEDWKTLAPSQSVDQLYQNELKATPDSIRAYQKNIYFDGKWKDSYEPLVQILAGWTQHSDYPKVAWSAALTADMLWNQPVVYEFPKIKAKTLLIIGTRDRTALGRDRIIDKNQRDKVGRYDQLGRKTARLIPGAKLIELKNVGHIPQVEDFESYKKAVSDFL